MRIAILGGGEMTYKPWTYHMAHKRIKDVAIYQRPWLVLERLGLTDLPEEVFQLGHLDELIVIDNLLTTLPPEIQMLKSLTRICMFYNEISSIPPEIGEMKHLTHLDLSCNKLKVLPEELKKLTRLKYLDLRYNMLPIAEEVLDQVDKPELILRAYFEQRVVVGK
jgi:Leucine-rich repeat (LRR) protein